MTTLFIEKYDHTNIGWETVRDKYYNPWLKKQKGKGKKVGIKR